MIAFAVLTAAASVLAEQSPVWVDVTVNQELLDAGALREAIGKELDCAVVVNREAAHSGEIVIKPLASGQPSVAFLPPDCLAPLQRVVTLPRTRENRVQLIAWLVGNMARNEAAEWLADRQREKRAKAAVPSETLATTEASNSTAKPAEKPVEEQQDGSAGNAANKKESDNPPRPVTQPPATAAPRDVSNPSISTSVHCIVIRSILRSGTGCSNCTRMPRSLALGFTWGLATVELARSTALHSTHFIIAMTSICTVSPAPSFGLARATPRVLHSALVWLRQRETCEAPTWPR